MNNLEMAKTFVEIAEFLAHNDSHGTDIDIKCPMGKLKCHFEFEIVLQEDEYDD